MAGAGAPNGKVTIGNLLGSNAHTREQSVSKEIQSIALSAKVPWRMAETNSCNRGGERGVSDVFAASLWGVDYMFTLAGASATGVNFHGGAGDPRRLMGRQMPRSVLVPCTMGCCYFTPPGRGGLVPVDLKAGGLNLRAYAASDKDGTLLLTAINMDSRDGTVRLTPVRPMRGRSPSG